uniref:Putative allatotropin n=1 Tax=Corethrella appendiculata TaxID=1370023 RepID=U5EU06_9DIPT
MADCKLLFLIVSTTTILLCCHTINATPARQLALAASRVSKIPRSIRAPFRNSEMMTARGFGKRRVVLGGPGGGGGGRHFQTNEEIPWNYEKREIKYLNDLSQQQQDLSDSIQQLLSEQSSLPDNIPIDWLTNELSTNPHLIKNILQRFIDTNKDGFLSPNELLAALTALSQQQQQQLQQQSSSATGSSNNNSNDSNDLY